MISRSTFLATIVACLAICVAVFHRNLARLYKVKNLFKETNIVQNFRSVDIVGFPHVTVDTRNASVATFAPPPDNVQGLPDTFTWNDTVHNLPDWIEKHWTTGLVVIKRDESSPTVAKILHESYYRGNDANSRCISWSICKSIISIMLGVAVDRGIIGDIAKETTTDYLPELKGTGYDGVTLKDLLEMSSGVDFNEDYFHPLSDINMMSYILALGGSMDQFVKRLKRGRAPGTRNEYVSINTQVLGMILKRASKQTLASFLEENIWSKVGFESNAIWCLDNEADRMELAFGIIGITTRDYARLGWLMLNRGLSPATGERILSEEWVAASTSVGEPHLMPGEDNKDMDIPFFGYGYQWWVGPSAEDASKPGTDFLGIGIYGQMLYVSPEHGVVIVKNAASISFSSMKNPETHENYLGVQGYYALREIARHFSNA